MIPAFLAVAVCLQTPAKPVDERHAVYEWLDSLSYPFLTAPFVEVEEFGYVGGSRKSAGFLTGKGENSFKVLSADLLPSYYSASVSQFEGAKYRPVELKTWLERNELKITNPPQNENWRNDNHYDLPKGRVALCVLSRLCEAKGWSPQAIRFFQAAHDGNYALYTGAGRYRQVGTLLECLKGELAARIARSLVFEVASTVVPRADTLANAAAYLRNFPEGEDRPFVQEVVARLGEQERERATHVAPDPNTATRDQLVAEAVYQLQDISGSPMMHPGFYDATRTDQAKRLIGFGFDAVPRLIDTLDDRRFTFAHDDAMHNQSPLVLIRVRDAAVQILGKIAGRDFERRTPLDDATAKTAKEEALAWWAKAEKIGEIPTLEAAIRSGTGNMYNAAERLLKLEPDGAVEVILEGFSKMQEPYMRSNVITLLDRSNATGTKEFARDQMLHSPDSNVRLAAAELLFRSEPETAVDAMTGELVKLPAGEEGYFDRSLIEFLLSSGRTRAVRAVRVRFSKLDPDLRLDAVTFAGLQPEHPPVLDQSGEYRREIEDLLAEALNDTTRHLGTSMSLGEQSFDAPRTCDVASYRLWEQFKPKYRFSSTASERQREQIRFQNTNIWRTSRGLAPNPLPIEKPNPETPSAVIQPLLAKAKSNDVRARRQSLAKISQLGLPALRPLRRTLQALPQIHPAKTDMSETAGRLALTVSHVTVLPSKIGVDKWMADLAGRPLDLASLKRLFSEADRGSQVTVTISRSDDLLGVEIKWVRDKTKRHVNDLSVSVIGNIGSYTDNSGSSGDAEIIERDNLQFILRILAAKPKDPIFLVYTARN